MFTLLLLIGLPQPASLPLGLLPCPVCDDLGHRAASHPSGPKPNSVVGFSHGISLVWTCSCAALDEQVD